jgi:hypothetical protein
MHLLEADVLVLCRERINIDTLEAVTEDANGHGCQLKVDLRAIAISGDVLRCLHRPIFA